MTYSLNGVPFDHSDLGWRFRSTSRPLADLEVGVTSIRSQGRHGAFRSPLGVLGVPVIRLVVQTPRAHLRTLEALVKSGGVLTSTYEPGEMTVEFVSASPTGFGPSDAIVDLAIVFRVPDAVARDGTVTSPALTLGAAAVTVPSLFPGLSAEVQDAIVRVKGAVTGLQVTDSGGSWFTYSGSLTGSQWLRFESGTGRAFVTATDSWTGGTEVSGNVDFGGPRGVFEIAPRWTSNPATRAGQLTVATASRSGAEVQVRGRSAHLV